MEIKLIGFCKALGHKTIIFMAQMERHLLLISQTPKTFPSIFLISKGMEVAA